MEPSIRLPNTSPRRDIHSKVLTVHMYSRGAARPLPVMCRTAIASNGEPRPATNLQPLTLINLLCDCKRFRVLHVPPLIYP